MKYPVSQLQTTEAEMEAFAQRMQSLANRAQSANSVISSCYGQGGVYGRAGAVAIMITGQAKAISGLGKVTTAAAELYLTAQDNICTEVYSASGEVYTRPVVEPNPEPVEQKMSTWTKIWKTGAAVVAIGTAAVSIAATWAAAGVTAGVGVPGAVLVSAYGVNTIANKATDLYNIWGGDESKVGKVNYLKDTLTESGGDLAEMLGADRDIGEMLGKGLYGVGEITSSVISAKSIGAWKQRGSGTSIDDDLKNKLLEKIPGAKWDKYTQSSMFDFHQTPLSSKPLSIYEKISTGQTGFGLVDTGVNAIKEIPKAIGGVVDIAQNFSLDRIAYDMASLEDEISNIKKVVDFVKETKGIIDQAGKYKDLVEKVQPPSTIPNPI